MSLSLRSESVDIDRRDLIFYMLTSSKGAALLPPPLALALDPKKPEPADPDFRRALAKPDPEPSPNAGMLLFEPDGIVYIERTMLAKKFTGTCVNARGAPPRALHICIYRIDRTCITPFVAFAAQPLPQTKRAAHSSAFPRVAFRCPVFWEPSPAAAQTDDDDDADDPQQHTYFMNESMSALLDVLPIHAQLSPALVRRIYMGFIELETPDDIFVFFDCTHLFGPGSTPLSLSGGYEWTLMSELQSPRFAPDAALARLLAKHPELTRVRNTALVPFETPMALSACAQPYAAPPARDAVTEARARTLGLAPALPVDTRFFGSAYLFVSPGGRGRERRCAVFAGAHSYTLPFPVGALSDDEARVLEHQLEDLDIAVLHFVDGAHDVWAVKAPNHFTPL